MKHIIYMCVSLTYTVKPWHIATVHSNFCSQTSMGTKLGFGCMYFPVTVLCSLFPTVDHTQLYL